MIKCTYEDGKQAVLRHVTVDALIIKDRHLLLVQRAADYFIEPGKWVLPGGYLERDESTTQAIKREVLEETGYQAHSAKLFCLMTTPRLKGDDRQNIGCFYLVEVGKQTHTHDYEINAVNWFPLDHVPPAKAIGFDHLDIIKLYKKYRSRPFSLPVIND